MCYSAITFQIKHLYLSGVWVGEYQTTNTIKIRMFNRDQIMPLLTTSHSTMKHNWEDPCHMSFVNTNRKPWCSVTHTQMLI